MSRRKKRKPPPATEKPQLPEAPAREGRGRLLWRDVQKSALLSAIIIMVMMAIEHTSAGKRLETLGYNLLQGRLRSTAVPVTIVDISTLVTRPNVPTARQTILDAINAIAGQGPSAIGVDIDFSPDDLGYQHPRDPSFFDACLEITERKGVPVYLGIVRTVLKPPAQWLGDPKYQSLAANILVPIDSRQMVHAVDVGSETRAVLPLRSLSAVLAKAHDARSSRAHLSPAVRALERWGVLESITTIVLAKGLSLREFWVDYSPIEKIRDEAFLTTDPNFLGHPANRKHLKDHVVILGDLNAQLSDRFIVRGRDYPGVLLHASAANTLLTGPLYVITPRGRLFIDVVCILLVLASLTMIRWMYEPRGQMRVAVARLQVLLTILLLLAPFAAGVAFVRSTRILWNDFILTASVLLLHPSLEHRLVTWWNRAGDIARRMFIRLAFEKRREAE